MIDRALRITEDELDTVRTERKALTRFLDRIQDIDPERRDRTGSIEDDQLISAPVRETHSDALAQIRAAYRETVMAVPHYACEYGDTLPESCAAEFGETVAGQLVDGQCLTPALYDALLTASETARDERDDFVRVLRREYQSLQTIDAELASIESRREDLSQQITATSKSERLGRIDDSLDQLDRRCTDLASRRQGLIHGRSTSILSGVDERSLVHYLYADLETVTPALFAITCCLDRIRHQRMRCLR